MVTEEVRCLTFVAAGLPLSFLFLFLSGPSNGDGQGGLEWNIHAPRLVMTLGGEILDAQITVTDRGYLHSLCLICATTGIVGDIGLSLTGDVQGRK